LLKNIVRKREKQCFYVRLKIRRKIKKFFPVVGKRFYRYLKPFSKNTVHPVTGEQTYGAIFADTMRRIFLVKY